MGCITWSCGGTYAGVAVCSATILGKHRIPVQFPFFFQYGRYVVQMKMVVIGIAACFLRHVAGMLMVGAGMCVQIRAIFVRILMMVIRQAYSKRIYAEQQAE
jgi:hypothetical protein